MAFSFPPHHPHPRRAIITSSISWLILHHLYIHGSREKKKKRRRDRKSVRERAPKGGKRLVGMDLFQLVLLHRLIFPRLGCLSIQLFGCELVVNPSVSQMIFLVVHYIHLLMCIWMDIWMDIYVYMYLEIE